MYVTMMMTDQMMELPPPLLNGEVPVMHHMMNGDASQQVIVVQVNPGETFTIRAEDGSLQCIQGPAEVPMMSPNGSIPPIHVPPGYISQVLEDNTGVRRVVVTPHSECYPPSYSPALSPTHHMPPPYMAHPHFIPASHTAYYPPTSPSDVPPHQYYQHRIPRLYAEEIIHNIHYNMTSSYINRDEPYCKPQPKKVKGPPERGSQAHGSSPPSAPAYKGGPASSATANGYTKGHGGAGSNGGTGGGGGGGGSPGNKRPERRIRGSPKGSDLEQQQQHDHNGAEVPRVQDMLSGMDKPQVSQVQSRSALVSWSPVAMVSGRSQHADGAPTPCSYELLLTDKGVEGKYRLVYSGEQLECNLTDLRPATDYHVRVSAVCDTFRGPRSEAGTFTTHCGPPDTPVVPRLSHRSKSSLTLQWKPPVDNGSKITNYKLEWDEGKKNGAFRECYHGNQRHFKVTRLYPATGYTFRVSARNDIGTSGFSPEVTFHTTGTAPQQPPAPQVQGVGSDWLSLAWTRPTGCGSEESLTYILELRESNQGPEFHIRYNGTDISYTVDGLKRNSQYSFRLTACSAEWRIGPSVALVCKTLPERPGPPANLAVRDITAHSLCAFWQPPEDDGGSDGLTYILELLEEPAQEEGHWMEVYRGPALERVCGGLRPSTGYSLRIHCLSAGGQSQHSPCLTVQSLCLPPTACKPPRIVGKVRHKEVHLEWDGPVCEGAGAALSFTVEMRTMELRPEQNTQILPEEETKKEKEEEKHQEQQAQHEEEENKQEAQMQEAQAPAAQCQPVEVYQGEATECTVGSLLPGATYLFHVCAANAGGAGPYSEALTVTTAAGPPGQCGIPCITMTSHTSATVSWESCEDSDADISEYRLSWGQDPAALEVVYCGLDTSCHISNLEAASQYCCRLQAANQDGAGPHSEMVSCSTPAAAPATVPAIFLLEQPFTTSTSSTTTTLHPPSTSLALTWEEPSCNGAEITTYTVVVGGQSFVAGNVTNYTVTGLQPNTEYSVQVCAENAIGVGPLCTPLLLRTRPLPPAPPHLECAAIGPQSLKLRWGDSSGPRGAQSHEDVTYILQMEDRTQRFVSIYRGPSHTYRVQRLNESTQYTFRIQAVSDAGEGPYSETLSLCTTKSVPPTLKAPRVTQLEGNACEVTWEACSSMRGDRITYTLQVLGGRDSDFKQVFKGEETCFQLASLQWNSDYRFRVCANRHCLDISQELSGAFSPSALFMPRRIEPALTAGTAELGVGSAVAVPATVKAFGITSTDQQFATLLVLGLASLSFLLAFLLQLFLLD